MPTIEEWNLTVEQGITTNTSLRLSYVGSHGYHELIFEDDNAIRAQICSNLAGCTSGGVGKTTGTVLQGAQYIPVGTRPNPFLASGQFWVDRGDSSYNSLVVEVTHRFSSGLQFRGNYTWSKNLDINSGMGGAATANSPYTIMDINQPSRDWGPSAEDQTHKFVFSGGYELPFGAGKSLLGNAKGVEAKIANGWQINWIVTAQSGFSLTPFVGSNQSGNGDTRSPDRPNLAPGFTNVSTSGTTGAANPTIPPTAAVPQGFACAGVPANQPLGTPTLWFNPCALSLPTAGTWGDLGKGTLRGPGFFDLDLSLFKTTSISERVSLQFRAESFNLLNHANFGIPGTGVFSGNTVSPSAGLITNTTNDSRRVQLGLKLIF